MSSDIIVQASINGIRVLGVENDESKRWKNIVLTLIRIMVRVTYIFILEMFPKLDRYKYI